jgi:cell shape-determining protein MreC
MKSKILLPVTLIAVITILIFFGPAYGWELRKFLGRESTTGVEQFTLENQNLKTELAKLQNIKNEFPEGVRGSILGVVYSRYPFNFKNQFLINAGKTNGVSANAAITFGGVLVGKVAKVFDDMALVRTVFDSEFQTPVRIGNAGIEALFKGGNLPKVMLIPMKSEVQKGDIIYSSSPDFPYGLPIGEIADVTMSADQLFKEATVVFAYDINTIQTVLVAK